MKSKQKKPVLSIILYLASAVVAILGTAFLINNVLLYSNSVTQYVAQGYSLDMVTAQLIPSQLIPGVLEPVCIYYGVALLLAAAGVINDKLTKCLAELTKNLTDEAIEQPLLDSANQEEDIKDESQVDVIDDKETIDECNSSVEDEK